MKNTSSPARRGLVYKMVLAPYSLWALLFILVPLIFVAYYAFTDQNFNFTFDNITRFFTATSTVSDGEATKEIHTYLVIFARSLKLAVISTVICLIMGYPMAYIISRSSQRTHNILITLIMIPMWMNFLIRTYAWMTILQDTGIFNGLLGLVGLGPVHIIGTESAVVIGMVYDYFPYMILPIYSIMAKMDVKLIEAAKDLGCNSLGVLRRVIWPLSLPGVISGIIMVLIPSISTFYISQKLGNGKFYLIGDAIEGQYVANNLHFAAAIAFILMVILLVCMAFMHFVFLPVEDEEVDTEHVERCHTCYHRHPQAPNGALFVASHQDFVLREETCEWRNTRNCQATDKECDIADRHVFAQTVHRAVFIAVNSVNHCTGNEEEQCLEHCVSEEVEH